MTEGSCPSKMAAIKKKPLAKISARAHDIRSGNSRCCTCCMNRKPLFHYNQLRKHIWMDPTIVDNSVISWIRIISSLCYLIGERLAIRNETILEIAIRGRIEDLR